MICNFNIYDINNKPILQEINEKQLRNKKAKTKYMICNFNRHDINNEPILLEKNI